MMISYAHVRYRDSTNGTDRLRSRTAEDRSNNGRNSQPVGIALKRCVPGKDADHRSEAQTQDDRRFAVSIFLRKQLPQEFENGAIQVHLGLLGRRGGEGVEFQLDFLGAR